MSDYREILYAVDEQIATVTFNRPEHRNPISTAMLDEVQRAVRDAHRDEAVRVLVITGAGRAFCSGGDVKSMAQAASADGGALATRQEQGSRCRSRPRWTSSARRSGCCARPRTTRRGCARSGSGDRPASRATD